MDGARWPRVGWCELADEVEHPAYVGVGKALDGEGVVDTQMDDEEAHRRGGWVECLEEAWEAVGLDGHRVGIGDVFLGVEQHYHRVGLPAVVVGVDGGLGAPMVGVVEEAAR